MKKIACILIALIISVSVCSIAVPASADVVRGDSYNDGTLDMKDLLFIKKYIAGYNMSVYSTFDLELADYNSDGKVNIKDALGVATIVIGTWSKVY